MTDHASFLYQNKYLFDYLIATHLNVTCGDRFDDDDIRLPVCSGPDPL